jgi:hypothetical protein
MRCLRIDRRFESDAALEPATGSFGVQRAEACGDGQIDRVC